MGPLEGMDPGHVEKQSGHTPPQPKDTGKLGDRCRGRMLHIWPARWLIGGSKHFRLRKMLDGCLVSAHSGTQLAAFVRRLFK